MHARVGKMHTLKTMYELSFLIYISFRYAETLQVCLIYQLRSLKDLTHLKYSTASLWLIWEVQQQITTSVI